MAKTLTNFNITFTDFPFDETWSAIVFFLGCEHNCFGCQNPELQNENTIELQTTDWQNDYELFYYELRKFMDRNHTDKVVLTGGDPLFSLEFVKGFLSLAKDNISVCIYTGYDKEFCIEKGIVDFDYLKTGVYKKGFVPVGKLASHNQRLYDDKYADITCFWRP